MIIVWGIFLLSYGEGDTTYADKADNAREGGWEDADIGGKRGRVALKMLTFADKVGRGI